MHIIIINPPSRVIKSGNLSGFIASKKQGLAGGYFVEKFERKVEKFLSKTCDLS